MSLDALGCRPDIASTIVEAGGGYLLAVKDN
ncbi:MAG: transposase [Caldilineaceae bacterium SB0665_bin_21]|nr:transposase [Caldilineaceae bacterium SB0665_bin_21]